MAEPEKDWFPNDKATHEWLDTQKKSTRDTYQTHWKHFLEFVGMTGDQILADKKEDKEHKWERTVLQFKQWLIEKKSQSGNTATTAAMAVRGFFGFHYEMLKYRRSEAKRLQERTRKTEDYRFSRKDLKKMCDFADLKEKYVITAGKSFGLRAGDFLRLTRGDLEPYLDRDVPISIGQLGTGKEKVSAYPFIDSDALPIIKRMIEQMNREGRTKSADRILTYRRERELSRIIKRVAEKAGIKFGNKQVRFHCLRKYLTDRLSSYLSESKWKQVVGKAIGEKAYVSPDELRKDYARAMADTCWTETVGTADIRMQAKIDALAAIARSKGVSEATINEIITMIERKEIAEEEAIVLLEQLTIEDIKPKQTELNGEDCQRIVSEDELGGYLAKGWKVQAVLPSGRIVVDNEH